MTKVKNLVRTVWEEYPEFVLGTMIFIVGAIIVWSELTGK